MANRDIDVMKKQRKAHIGIFGAALAAVLTGAAKAQSAKKSKENKEQARQYELRQINSEIDKINSQIDTIDTEISNLRSGLLGSWLNSDQITEYQQLRSQLVAKKNQLLQRKNSL